VSHDIEETGEASAGEDLGQNVEEEDKDEEPKEM